ncbi:MAG: hypothetical protein P1V29_07875 [Gammaproteobacteria bacterium]|jgi:hypothetical protein|nr:hypothetical protein [Gammaproteobacteria bacterium]
MSLFIRLTKTLAAGVALSALFAASAFAQRTDLNGTFTNMSLTGLTRPEGVEPLVVDAALAQEIANGTSIAGLPAGALDEGEEGTDDGAPAAGSIDFGLRGYNSFWTDPGSQLANVMGEFRTSYVIDPPNGQIPRLEEPLFDLNRKNFGYRYLTGIGDNSGPEALPLAERCLIGFGNTAGPGMMGTLYNSTYQFIQTPDHVAIIVEMAHDARIIPTFGSAEEARANRRPAVLEQWFGDSVGWYEGSTLVVETANIKPLQMEQSSVPVSPTGTITERFTRYSDTEIVYQFIVDDSNLYSQPWTAELSFHETDGQMYEYACHEGNYAMPGILAGARRAEMEGAE